MNTPVPNLTFFCELEAMPLVELFSHPDVLPFLQVTHSTISLGIIDLSSQRAEVVRQLNAAGVPVTAWLLLPKDQGYWFNLDNYLQAKARYEQFKNWTKEHNLQWTRIGIDIEPDLRVVQQFSVWNFSHLPRLINHMFDNLRLLHGKNAYHHLIETIHADGYRVETYQFPFIIDERIAHSNLLQKLTGLVDLPEIDNEVLMLYSSFIRPWGQGFLWSYAPYARGVGVGSTGGGMTLEGSLATRPLNWSELETDLLLARRHTENIYIFSFEGCVQQDMLPLITAMEWQAEVSLPLEYTRRINAYRKLARRLLWMSGRLAGLLFVLALVISLVTWIRRRNR